mmetsp:Transcript_77797/g.228068  ORF Transcript_77797/g.228068 Transcript_77797/m.228068 type:complete len:204 (+) Transcript_77797:182-793(+)
MHLRPTASWGGSRRGSPPVQRLLQGPGAPALQQDPWRRGRRPPRRAWPLPPMRKCRRWTAAWAASWATRWGMRSVRRWSSLLCGTAPQSSPRCARTTSGSPPTTTPSASSRASGRMTTPWLSASPTRSSAAGASTGSTCASASTSGTATATTTPSAATLIAAPGPAWAWAATSRSPCTSGSARRSGGHRLQPATTSPAAMAPS